MTDPFSRFFQRQMRPAQPSAPDRAPLDPGAAEQRALHVAACALLLELAHADEHFTDDERTHIEAVMRRHFDLDEDTAQELIALAQLERSEAIDLYQFTRRIRESYDLGQKTLLAEIMWGVVMTDGEIAQHEAYMLRRIANLLDLKPGYLSAARRRVDGGDEPA
ncbi:MAG TPA: TerB family tellurite resistance protein [Longimicrobiales bacterium]